MRRLLIASLALTAMGCSAEQKLCDNLHVELTSVKPYPSKVMHLPKGGTHVTLDITNNNSIDVKLPGHKEVHIVTADKRDHQGLYSLGDGLWFMEETLPKGTKKSMGLVLDPGLSRDDLQEIRMNKVARADVPLPVCDLTAALK